MIYKFTLSHAIEGSKVISEPDGWEKSTLGFERHPEFHSLVEYFKSSFQAYGSNGTEDGGRSWLLNVEKLHGQDAEIDILVEIDEDETGVFETLYTGQLAVSMFVETLDTDHMLQMVFTQNGFWTKFISRYKNKVNIKSTVTESGDAVTAANDITLPLPSQIIDRTYKASLKHSRLLKYGSNSSDPEPIRPYILVGLDQEPVNEIQNRNSLSIIGFGSIDEITPQFNFSESGTLYVNLLKFTAAKPYTFEDPNYAANPNVTVLTKNNKYYTASERVNFYIQKNNETPILFSKSDRVIESSFNRNDGVLITNNDAVKVTSPLGSTFLSGNAKVVTDFSVTGLNFDVKKGDSIKIYGQIIQVATPSPSDFAYENAFFIFSGTDGWDRNNFDEEFSFSQNSTSVYVPTNRAANILMIDSRPLTTTLGSFQGTWSAIGNLFPTTSPRDGGGAVKIYDTWIVSDIGTLGGVSVDDTYLITALSNAPGQTASNWWVSQKSLYEGLEAYGQTEADIRLGTIAPDTTTKAFLTHDIMDAITKRITDNEATLYSEYLGNAFTSRVYGATGCGSLLANAKGLHIRGYTLTEKPFFKSAEEWWQGINPIYNLGLGYDKLSGNDIIRVERKEYFYDDGTPLVNLSNVYSIKRSYDSEHHFNQVEIGYDKWQSQAATGTGTASGIDDSQTKHTYNSRFRRIGNKITLFSKWVAASLTLETTRRVGVLKSSNYTYDDETFVIALRSLGAGGFTPELDENFTTLTNLTNKETRYNSRLTPARNFLRWANYLNGCLQSYIGSVFKFASGEGNFDMTSQMSTSCLGDSTLVNEKGNISVTSDFLFIPMRYEINHYLTWEEYKLIRDNRNLCIGISQTEANHKKFFIKTLEYQIGTGLLRLIAWPKEPFDIVVPDFVDDSPTRYYEDFYESQYE